MGEPENIKCSVKNNGELSALDGQVLCYTTEQ